MTNEKPIRAAFRRIRWGIEFNGAECVDCIADSPSASLAILEKRIDADGVRSLYENGGFRLVLVEVTERVVA